MGCIWWIGVALLLSCSLSSVTVLFVSARPLNSEVYLHRSQDEKCSFCIDVIKIAQAVLQSNHTLDDLFPLAEKLCADVLKEYSSAEYMCPGLIFSYEPVIQYVLTQKVSNPQLVCERFHVCNQSQLVSNGKWSEGLKEVLNKKYLVTGHRHQATGIETPDTSTKLSTGIGKELLNSSSQITFVQISDIHLDYQYAEGSPVNCGLYLCCRNWYNGSGVAGHYGSHQCDLPLVTLDLLLDTLKEFRPRPNFFVYTGDNPPHDVWNETWTSQLNATEFVVNYIASKLPGVAIYPAFGNHETWPESEYIGTLPQYEHLTKKLSEYWGKWVNFSEDALDTIAKGGYYSVKVLSNLRLISFNSNYGYSENLFTILNNENKHYWMQWHWLVGELSKAQRNGEKVLMIAHIPPGNPDNLVEYGEIYLNITKQFSDTITGHLFGHTHKDQFHVIQDDDGVYGVAMVAPSVTPYPTVNPSFRLFTLDANSLKLTGYQQYHLNLTMANEMYQNGSQMKPYFELSYSTKDEYQLQDLTPQSWADLLERFYQFPSLLDKYHYNVCGKSLASDKECNRECQRTTLCSVSNIISANYFKCLANNPTI